MVVDVDDGDQIVEPVAAGRHGRFPGRALVQLAVGQEVVDERLRLLALERQAHAHGDAEPVAERAAGDFHAGRVGGHARHRQAAVVGAVGLHLVLGDDAGLDQGGVERDGVVADGQQEAVAPLPFRIVGAVSAGRGNRPPPARRRCPAPGRCSPGPAPRPCAGHCGGCGRPGRRAIRWTAPRRAAVRLAWACGPPGVGHPGRAGVSAQWMSMPPLTSMTAPVM